MKITFANEVENIKDGSYTAILRDAFEFAPENLCMKFAICGDPESSAVIAGDRSSKHSIRMIRTC